MSNPLGLVGGDVAEPSRMSQAPRVGFQVGRIIEERVDRYKCCPRDRAGILRDPAKQPTMLRRKPGECRLEDVRAALLEFGQGKRTAALGSSTQLPNPPGHDGSPERGRRRCR